MIASTSSKVGDTPGSLRSDPAGIMISRPASSGVRKWTAAISAERSREAAAVERSKRATLSSPDNQRNACGMRCRPMGSRSRGRRFDKVVRQAGSSIGNRIVIKLGPTGIVVADDVDHVVERRQRFELVVAKRAGELSAQGGMFVHHHRQSRCVFRCRLDDHASIDCSCAETAIVACFGRAFTPCDLKLKSIFRFDRHSLTSNRAKRAPPQSARPRRRSAFAPRPHGDRSPHAAVP